jgi:hypothetical protein
LAAVALGHDEGRGAFEWFWGWELFWAFDAAYAADPMLACLLAYNTIGAHDAMSMLRLGWIAHSYRPLCSAAVWLTLGLWFFEIRLVNNNLTTNEYYNWKRYEYLKVPLHMCLSHCCEGCICGKARAWPCSLFRWFEQAKALEEILTAVYSWAAGRIGQVQEYIQQGAIPKLDCSLDREGPGQ